MYSNHAFQIVGPKLCTHFPTVFFTLTFIALKIFGEAPHYVAFSIPAL
jgi:hypothetical protein